MKHFLEAFNVRIVGIFLAPPTENCERFVSKKLQVVVVVVVVLLWLLKRKKHRKRHFI